MGQKEPPRLGNTICFGQTWARKSHRDSAVRFVTAEPGPERATKTRQYDLLRPNAGQKEPPRLGSTICYGQTWARKSHQDSAVRFVTAKSWPERATETRQYDLLRPNVGQKEPPRLGSTIWPKRATKTRQYDLARKSHQDSAVQFVTAKCGPERATKTRQYDLLRPIVGQKEPARLGSTTCYGQTWARKSHQDSAVRFDFGQKLARKNHQDSAIRFVPAKSCPERATKTRQYDLLRPKVGQKKPPRLGSTICDGQELTRKSHRTTCYSQKLARKSHRDSAVRFVTAKSWPERATKARQYDLLRPNVGQKEPPRLGKTICYAKRGPARATETRQYDLLRPNVGQKEPSRLGRTICYVQELARKEPPRLGSTICYGQTWARKSHQDSAVRLVTAEPGPERATKTRQYDLLRPNVGQKEPPRLGSTICYG